MEKTFKEFLVELIEEKGKPIRVKDILQSVLDKKYKGSVESIRVQLHHACKDGLVRAIKFPGTSQYYGKPEWFDKKGKLIIDFDPHWEKTKKDVV
jgi:hypothetical protein